jgi:hypothetical protein
VLNWLVALITVGKIAAAKILEQCFHFQKDVCKEIEVRPVCSA